MLARRRDRRCQRGVTGWHERKDDRRFDDLSRAVSGDVGSRRTLAKHLAGGALVSVAGWLGVVGAVAEKRTCPATRACGKKCCTKGQSCQARTCLDRCALDADCGPDRVCCDGGCCGAFSNGCNSAGRCRIGGLFGRNLLANPGAEAGPASPDGVQPVNVPGWQKSFEFTVVSYRLGRSFPTASDPGPENRGAKFFYGGGPMN